MLDYIAFPDQRYPEFLFLPHDLGKNLDVFGFHLLVFVLQKQRADGDLCPGFYSLFDG